MRGPTCSTSWFMTASRAEQATERRRITGLGATLDFHHGLLELLALAGCRKTAVQARDNARLRGCRITNDNVDAGTGRTERGGGRGET